MLEYSILQKVPELESPNLAALGRTYPKFQPGRTYPNLAKPSQTLPIETEHPTGSTPHWLTAFYNGLCDVFLVYKGLIYYFFSVWIHLSLFHPHYCPSQKSAPSLPLPLNIETISKWHFQPSSCHPNSAPEFLPESTSDLFCIKCDLTTWTDGVQSLWKHLWHEIWVYNRQETSEKNEPKEKEVNVAYGMLIRYMHTSSTDKIFVLRLVIPTKINTDVKQLREVNSLAG